MCVVFAGVSVIGTVPSKPSASLPKFNYDIIVPPSSQGKRRENQIQQARVRQCSVTVVAIGKFPELSCLHSATPMVTNMLCATGRYISEEEEAAVAEILSSNTVSRGVVCGEVGPDKGHYHLQGLWEVCSSSTAAVSAIIKHKVRSPPSLTYVSPVCFYKTVFFFVCRFGETTVTYEVLCVLRSWLARESTPGRLCRATVSKIICQVRHVLLDYI